MPQSRAAQQLSSLAGQTRTINEGSHAPVHVHVERREPGYLVTVENSDGSWECPVTGEGIVEEIRTGSGRGEHPRWVAVLLENLGFREVPLEVVV